MSSQFWRLEVQDRNVSGATLSPKALGENWSHTSLLTFCGPSNLWCCLTCRCVTQITAPVSCSHHPSECVSVFLILFLQTYQPYWMRTYPAPGWHLCWPYVQIRPHSGFGNGLGEDATQLGTLTNPPASSLPLPHVHFTSFCLLLGTQSITDKCVLNEIFKLKWVLKRRRPKASARSADTRVSCAAPPVLPQLY